MVHIILYFLTNIPALGKDLGLDGLEQFDNKYNNYDGTQPFQLNHKSPIFDKTDFCHEDHGTF